MQYLSYLLIQMHSIIIIQKININYKMTDILQKQKISRNISSIILSTNQNLNKRYKDEDMSSTSRKKILHRKSQNSNQHNKNKVYTKFKKSQPLTRPPNQYSSKNNQTNITQDLQNSLTFTKSVSDIFPNNISQSNDLAGFKYLRNLVIQPKFDLVSQKKILDHKTRPSTPIHKDEKVLSQQQQQRRKIEVFQNKIFDLQAKVMQGQSYKQKCIELQNEIKKDGQKISKLIEKISRLNKEKSEKEEQLQRILREKARQNESKEKDYVRNEYKLNQHIKKMMQQNKKYMQQNKILKIQNDKMNRLNEMYVKQIQQLQKQKNKNYSNQFDKFNTTKQICLQNCIQQLRKQIQNQQNQLYQRVLIEKFTNLKKQLNYYKIANYCLQKKLTQALQQNHKKISPQQYNQLKSKYKKLTIQYRKIKNFKPQKYSQNNDQLFYLTPEKDIHSFK